MTDSGYFHPLIVAQQAGQAHPSRPVAVRDRELAQAREAAQEFEAVFLSQMLEHMFAGVSTDGLFGGGQAESTYRSLMLTEYGRVIARAGGVGIADQVMAEILKLQEIH